MAKRDKVSLTRWYSVITLNATLVDDNTVQCGDILYRLQGQYCSLSGGTFNGSEFVNTLRYIQR